MKLEVGMYVRTKKYGIAKIIGNVDDNKFNIDIFKKDGITLRCQKMKDIIKASHNIIDLIEEGDYVNGLPVVHNAKYNGGNIIIVINGNAYTELEIRNIVTKEQFESIKYEVKW